MKSMTRKERIDEHVHAIAQEILDYIKENESEFDGRWVPSIQITKQLGLKYDCCPKSNKQYGTRDWLFGIAARILEDQEYVEYKKDGSRAYYRVKNG